MKSIAIISLNNVNNDSRIKKYINQFTSFFKVTIVSTDKLIRNKKYLSIQIEYKRKRKNKSLFDFCYYYLILRYKLFKIIKSNNYNLVWANDLETLIPAYFALIKSPKRISYDSHEIWTERTGCKRSKMHRIINLIEEKLEKHIVHKVNHIITVSDDIAEILKNKWDYKKEIATIRNIPDENYSENFHISRTDLGIPTNLILFVYAGIISNERNIPNMVKAFIELDRKDIGLLLIGNSYLDIETYNKAYSNIYFKNNVPENHLYHYLRIADIGIHPLNTNISLNHKYCLPNKVFQYMQAGLGLCLFSNNSTDNILSKYKNGISGNMNSQNDILINILKVLKMNKIIIKSNSIIAYKNEYNWIYEKVKLKNILMDL